MSTIFYTHSKKDLEEVVKVIMSEMKKIELNNSEEIFEGDKLSQREAALFLGISQTSIIAWKKQGKVPYYQIGKRVFYSKKELLQMARQNRELLTSKRAY